MGAFIALVNCGNTSGCRVRLDLLRLERRNNSAPVLWGAAQHPCLQQSAEDEKTTAPADMYISSCDRSQCTAGALQRARKRKECKTATCTESKPKRSALLPLPRLSSTEAPEKETCEGHERVFDRRARARLERPSEESSALWSHALRGSIRLHPAAAKAFSIVSRRSITPSRQRRPNRRRRLSRPRSTRCKSGDARLLSMMPMSAAGCDRPPWMPSGRGREGRCDWMAITPISSMGRQGVDFRATAARDDVARSVGPAPPLIRAAGATCWVFCSDSTITSSTNEKAASSAKKKRLRPRPRWRAVAHRPQPE